MGHNENEVKDNMEWMTLTTHIRDTHAHTPSVTNTTIVWAYVCMYICMYEHSPTP